MKPVIVGTAGHIDHGKTALVRALTGIDTDRLAEEKRRGITIDIGFANLELAAASGEKLRIGFVDVPGHERFIRNMLAGVGGIDLVMLIISAEESIKPQTREHFDICRMLGIERGLTVLTKSDLVDEETLEVVKAEAREFVAGSFLEGSPVVAVSAKTGAGIAELKLELASVAVESRVKDAQAAMRLPIDRVFTMKGHGTVVTGTLISGTVKKEQEVEVHPREMKTRVRNVQVHGASAESAVAGQRTALNLANVAVEDLTRGMVLTEAGQFHPTRRVDVKLELLNGAPALKDRARVHFHAHTAETVAAVLLHEKKPKLESGTAYAQLRLAKPALLLPGDRFIVRQFSPLVTIGGGVVLDAEPLASPERLEFLRTLESGYAAEILKARVARRKSRGLTVAGAIAETGWMRGQFASRLKQLVEAKQVVQFGQHLLTSSVVSQLETGLVKHVNRFHDENRLVAGIGKETLRERVGAEPEIFAGVLERLVAAKKLIVSGEVVQAPGRGVAMKSDESESKKLIEDAFAKAGLQVPALKDVLAGVKLDHTRAQQVVTLLLRDRVLVKVSEELVFHQNALVDLRTRVVSAKSASPRIDVARFKELTGLTRKYAIPLLEWLDRERVTKRVGEERVIL
ncbi:selenocysteine-specific translation elongation factor SelB [Candidatus Koribacter versatilis Ellin345]|uniref:Selenocysteine-specific elongation factor n=1 Tax=Koribacter versatilis (strain Ellin345) TaxID=204669 RepID=Q1IHM2_KORVE|nr:selenocysteine-specific translation elongation factor [Candidatus Koribacter versatilis]ABF43628.1 selenocysteine-specific translation elongation factor SelB [Candidatus Koribacter versatilis Ellin345]